MLKIINCFRLPLKCSLKPSIIQSRHHGSWPDDNSLKININFKEKNGNIRTVVAPIGVSVLDVAHHYDIDIEGACEASLACCTCHVIVDDASFAKLPEATEAEEDLLDLAPCITPTSRLSCQIISNENIDGISVALPSMTRNFYVDGHIPKPH
eukprot:GHVL01010262.1.p2 GENE.GHVL01010262.1~~GHVL01010262.1.p2  ORF type:complete len:153 (+),score=26.98 GHVL01010262.1:1389-1847(+)